MRLKNNMIIIVFSLFYFFFFFFFQAEDGIRDGHVTGVQTCALPISSRYSPEANNLTNIPGNYGILGVSQQALNGGLPAFGINGLQTLGSNAFLPSDEVTSTIQLTDDVTKIYSKHTFKMGIEYQHVKFSTLQ